MHISIYQLIVINRQFCILGIGLELACNRGNIIKKSLM